MAGIDRLILPLLILGFLVAGGFGIRPQSRILSRHLYLPIINASAEIITLIQDTFTDVNTTALSDHTPNTAPLGASWAYSISDGGPITILTDKAILPDSLETAGYTIDPGQADLVITCDITLPADTIMTGILARYYDGSNYFRFYLNATTAYIAKVEGGSATILDSAAHELTDTASLTIRIKGNLLTFDVGSASLSAVSSFEAGVTPIGIIGYTDGMAGAVTWDNLLVTTNP